MIAKQEGMNPAVALESARPKRRKKVKLKPTLHKYSRVLHAYVSAFAFLILMFFAFSGLLLNHPEWFSAEKEGQEGVEEALSLEQVENAMQATDPGKALADLARAAVPIVGSYKSSEVFEGEEAYLRFAGAKGNSDVVVNLESGEIEYEVERAGLVEIMHNLHRGKDAGAVWKALIDVSAILILALSLFGFALMLFIKIRVWKNLLLVGTSTVLIFCVYLFLVP